MKTINPETAVIVFDLDDTLYSEYEYKLSGIRAIVDTVATLYPDWDSDDLWRSIDPDGKDWLDKLCRHCGFNESEKQVLLWQYQLHRPTLTPYAPHDFLSKLTAPFAARALITDGRSLTQRLKLEALGLYSLFDDILVSEACASEKPDGKRFRYLRQICRKGRLFHLHRRQPFQRLHRAERFGLDHHRAASVRAQYSPPLTRKL